MTEQTLVKCIAEDVAAQKLERFYSITNEVGYELSLTSSETESDSDTELDETKYEDGVTERKYSCELCHSTFPRKYKLFAHQMSTHDWQDAPHVCAYCDARFLAAALLQQHYERQCRDSQKRFVCRKCSYRFTWKENLKNHLRTAHPDEVNAKKSDLLQRTFDCLECKRSFQMQKDLTRHMIVHRSDVSVLACLWCSRKFYREENLHLHIRRHGVTADSLSIAKCLISATSGPNGRKKIHCKVCDLQFNNIADLRAHLLQITTSSISSSFAAQPHYDYDSAFNYSITNDRGFELQLDDSETDEESETAPTKPESGHAPYTCEVCQLKCKRKFEMALHQRSVHTYEKMPLKCDKCIFKTVSRDILVHHKRTQCYNTEKQLQCAKCSLRFMWQDNLEAHIRLQHVEMENELRGAVPTAGIASTQLVTPQMASTSPAASIFQCNQCLRKYNRKDRLTAHVKKMHTDSTVAGSVVKTERADNSQIDPITGEKPKKPSMEKKFLCAFCGRAVTSSSNLIIHMRRHTGEKPFKCDFCDMAFPRSSDLQCHRRTHTGEKPHKCTICDKAFSRSYKLQTHMRIHSGERPYKCTYCEKSFTQSNDLTLHIRRHTGERPYICGICGESFIQGTALRNHRIMRGHFDEVTEPKRAPIVDQY